MNKRALHALVGAVMMNATFGTPMPEPKLHNCPFCTAEFEGTPKYCPKCDKRLKKRGTSDQLIDEVNQ